MEVDSGTALGEFRVSRRPLTRRLQVPLKGLSAVLTRDVKVHENMSLRRQKIMEFGGVKFGKRRRNVVPFPLRRPLFRGVLRRTIRVLLIKKRFRTVEVQPAFLLRRFFIGSLRLPLELLFSE